MPALVFELNLYRSYSEFKTFQEFAEYRTLAPELPSELMDPRTLCEKICRVCMDPDSYQIGRDMVVLKKGMTANLNAHLEACAFDAAVRIQVQQQQLVDYLRGVLNVATCRLGCEDLSIVRRRAT